MQISIDIENETPLFAQLVEQVKALVQSEELKPRAALPSIRQLANDLDINNKTVSKAYKLLERDGVIQTKGYRGTFVHPEALSNCEVDLNHWLTESLSKTIQTLKAAGATDSEIRVAFTDIMNGKN